MDCVRKTLQWEGVGGLYKGVTSPLAGQVCRLAWRGNGAPLSGGGQHAATGAGSPARHGKHAAPLTRLRCLCLLRLSA